MKPYSWAVDKLLIVVFINYNIFQKPRRWVAAYKSRFAPFQHEPEEKNNDLYIDVIYNIQTN